MSQKIDLLENHPPVISKTVAAEFKLFKLSFSFSFTSLYHLYNYLITLRNSYFVQQSSCIFLSIKNHIYCFDSLKILFCCSLKNLHF